MQHYAIARNRCLADTRGHDGRLAKTRREQPALPMTSQSVGTG
ncbi:hypothetical protein RESH_02199 [Rhodopirellula europaea SH398]|uniref:Uncharacterized protein n=1 Tax=Rhodopirellula europaea SH398 TaxID=1263868 RepID=M5SHL3_9BACT|nr:hypothetical protein RESH_02199 [Rhodopirellula europaea SH398]